MNNFIKTINYYFLLLLGLSSASWIIWSRFMRERMIRDIPDGLFTELRFWILLYICIIYLYTVKTLFKPKEPNIIIQHLVDILYRPLIVLDHFFKYNKYLKLYYIENIHKLADHISYWDTKLFLQSCYIFQIIPRFILIIFLIQDVFYFNRLELFYKIVLIGLLPFIFRYVLYSFKDIYEELVKDLENKYTKILIFEDGYDYDLRRKGNTSAEHHYKHVSVKEYIEIKFENWIAYNSDEINFEYIGSPYSKDEVYIKYRMNKYGSNDAILTTEDYNEIKKLFKENIPLILELKVLLNRINFMKSNSGIKWFKIIIFSTYFICWFFTLTISYWCYPVDLIIPQTFFNHISFYLSLMNDSFNITEIQSETKLINVVIKIILFK